LGQHNTDVKALNSPKATFNVPVRNHGRRALRIRLEADGYELPSLGPCPPQRDDPERNERRVRARHGRDAHPVPEGWTVDLGDAAEGLQLDPGDSVDVAIEVTAPDGFAGRRALNVNGFAGERLIGGVTLIAEGDGT
jgi:hypothetical protein